MSDITKRALEASLKNLLLQKPLDKITINDIAEDCGISRMTFYYHFKDIYDLIEWSCVEDARRALEGKKTYDTWQQGFLQIFEAVQQNKPFIMNVYRSVSREHVENYLYKLIEMEEETGNHCKAEEIAEITEHMVSLFGLWDYGKVVPRLVIAVYRKDVEKCIQLIKEVLMESQKPWKMVESPLYYRYADTVQEKSFSGVGNNFVRALATEIENKEEYEFLKGNKELEAIFSQYLK